MKTKYLLEAFVVSGAILVAACQKEDTNALPDGAIRLTSEVFHGNGKTSVNGTSVQWDGNSTEMVNVNGNDYEVLVNGAGNAYIDPSGDIGAPVRGYYACGTVTTPDNTKPNEVTVQIPASYACSMNGSRQVIALPMAAYSSASNQVLAFKHLTAAVNVMIWNATSCDLFVDSVVVKTDSYRINGELAINLAAANFGISTDNSSVPDAKRRVKVTFATPLEIVTGEANAQCVQVPILPIGTDNITVEVYGYNFIEGAIPAVQSHTFCYKNASVALDRNVMLTARVKMDPQSTRVISKGTFTVNAAGKKVYFSQGNLQHQPSSSTWRFAENQYDAIGYNNGLVTATYTGWIDLYGWGTSGHYFPKENNVDVYGSSYQPWSKTKINTDYGPKSNSDLTGTFANGDWGVENAIGSSTAGTWYTLSTNAWDTIINIRTTNISNLPNSIANVRYTMATIGGTYKGMIVFPDDYVHPNGTGFTSGTYNGYSNYTATVSLAGWSLMEAAGAVFLPATGYRSWSGNAVTVYRENQGWYWSSSSFSINNAYCVVFTSTSVAATQNEERRIGMAVRLVTDAN